MSDTDEADVANGDVAALDVIDVMDIMEWRCNA
jgi:hypothetical protein